MPRKPAARSDAPSDSAPLAAPAPSARTVLSLDQVLGQDRAVALLRAAMAAQRLHHAWIFHGPPGVGKFTTAIAFAAMLLDPTTAPDLAGNPAPDPDSQVQHLIRAGTHPDLHVVTKELAAISRDEKVRGQKQYTIPKAVIDEFLLEPAARTRVLVNRSLVGKVFIVDEAELLDRWASHAPVQASMLKTLEEPPAGTLIILVTSDEDRLLMTVRSRCERVAFTPLDDAAMRTWLVRAGLAADAVQREWLLSFAAGSPGLALLASENGLHHWHQAIAPMLEQLDAGRFPGDLGATLSRLIDERAAAWVKARPDSSKDAANKAWARRMLAFLAEQARRSLHAAARPGAAQADPLVQARVRMIDLVAQAEAQVQANVKIEFVMENLAAQLAVRSASGSLV